MDTGLAVETAPGGLCGQASACADACHQVRNAGGGVFAPAGTPCEVVESGTSELGGVVMVRGVQGFVQLCGDTLLVF